ncbi:Zn-ribbon domain-containing OB-fold protein [Sinorhizobium fredii]|uniref:Zn-ribbon domain-containing OB-fold protein n=1 Tax=Rhizobium fredii TaxID=380 RepID=UPI000694A1EA|nr:OB-fold domain-containing protein [Sinorhizobium fredii]WOS65488.1 OB-fold domain-containing protein [Sinorhizobium fredii GR64]
MVAARPKPIKSIFDRHYWEFARRGELRLQRCEPCGTYRYPPAPVCPHCLSGAFEWNAVSGRGRVVSWTRFHRPYFPSIPVPYTVVSVETEEGPMLIGNLVGAGSDTPEFDMPVEAIFEPVSFDGEPWQLCQWRQANPK